MFLTLHVPQALAHPYMAELHDPEDEPECEGEFDFDYEKKENLSDANIRDLTFQEIKQYHNPASKFKKR